jgi:hypothetical protein
MSFANSNVWSKDLTVPSAPVPVNTRMAAYASRTASVRNLFSEMVKRKGSGDMEAALPEALTKEQLMDKYSDKVKELRVTKTDLQKIVDDTAQFRKFQESLRERRSFTHGVLALDYHYLVRERIDDMKNTTSMSANDMSPVSMKMTVDMSKEMLQDNVASPQSVTNFFSMGNCGAADLPGKPSSFATKYEVEGL